MAKKESAQSVYTVTLNPGLDRTLTVPEIQYNEVLRATESRLDWGGKGFNVSRALAAWGMESTAMGFVGGSIGQMLANGLQALGVATDFVPIDGETRTNTVVAELGSDRYIKVNEAGPLVSSEAVDALTARIRKMAAPGTYWALCGSLPPGVPPDIYAGLTEAIQLVDGCVILDTSGDALRAGCAAGPYCVKPNAEEAAAFTGRRVQTVREAQQAVHAFRDAGAQNVALSLGANGLVYATDQGVVHAVPPAVAVRTVVGVGDALLAGLIYATQLKLETRSVARWAVAAGTAAATGEGVSVGGKDAVDAMYARVAVRELA